MTLPITMNVITAITCAVFGSMVLYRNWRRPLNQLFALLSTVMMLWALAVTAVLFSSSADSIAFWIHFAEFVVCLIPPLVYHFVGHFPRGSFDGNSKLLKGLYAVAAICALRTLFPGYILSIRLRPELPPIVEHGPFFGVVLTFIGFAFLAVHSNLRRKLKESHGFSRLQTQFVMTGIYGIGVLSMALIFAEVMFNIRAFQAYGPIIIILLMGLFAYAMVRYHLLDTRAFVTRLLVYLGSAAFVVSLFMAVIAITGRLTGSQLEALDFLPAVMTALLVSLVFQTMQKRVEHFIEVTMLRRRYDIRRLANRLGDYTAEVGSIEHLLHQVATDIQRTIGVRVIRILLIDEEDPSLLSAEYSSVPGEARIHTREHTALLDFLRDVSRPVILEKLLHHTPTERTVRVARHLADLEAFLCLPLKTGDGLVGILTLGQKNTHDIYTEEESRLFRGLMGPLGTAIANARLYRELERVHGHQTKIFEQMREGVVAVDMNGVITSLNDPAKALTDGAQKGDHISAITSDIRELLTTTLETGEAVSDFEATLDGAEGEPVPVVMSSEPLRTPEDQITGAIALIYDISQVKRLERNVQRADRLSSIGTLAAGMAHEIKNPLVSIKTFTQLLMKKYSDPDFRNTFAEVVPHEVERIDTIVSRLLHFARPQAVQFSSNSIRTIIEQVVALTENQLRKANVQVLMDFPPKDLVVYADEQQLHQVFLNLILNAIEAMDPSQDNRLEISGRPGAIHHRHPTGPGIFETKCARIALRDSGSGIPANSLPSLFTPFFTTKDDGSGLGLAVVHGIVTEHGGEIDVSSTVGQGTTFFVSIPLAHDRIPAEAN